MKRKKTLSILLFLTTICMLISCTQLPSAQKTSSRIIQTTALSLSECIPPITNLALTVGLDESAPHPKPIPPINWEQISELPEPAGEPHPSFAVEKNNIWVSYNTKSTGKDKLFRYDLNQNAWKSYDITKDYYVHSSRLLVAKDGVVWSYYQNGIETEKSKFHLLSRYNPSLDQFEFVLDRQGLFQYPTEIRSAMVEDMNGLFWFFAKDTTENTISLYSFDSLTLQSKKHSLQLDAYTASIAFGLDGKLWVPDFVNNALLEYDPIKDKIRSFDRLGRTDIDRPVIELSDNILSDFSFLYFDRSGQLWLGSKGWLDISNLEHLVFYALIPSPVFVTYSDGGMLSGDPYLLDPATYNIYQSTNGWIWFTANAGVVRLTIEKGYQQGEWCLVTNGSSKVLEDGEGNLWMIVFDKIYKYHQ